MQTSRTTPSDRFWSKVVTTETCWVWVAATHPEGYGRFWADGRLFQAHRWAYIERYGEILNGMELDHLCRTRSCVRPDHLEPVSHAENVRRGRSGCNTAARTHCPKGHEYARENLMVSGGRRYCRTCHRARERFRRAARAVEVA